MSKTLLFFLVTTSIFFQSISPLSADDTKYHNTVFNIPFRVLDCNISDHGCSRLQDVPTDKIKSTFTIGGYIYVGSTDGAMWRCPVNTAKQCEKWNQAGSAIETIFVAKDSIYAGLANGIMWKCRTDNKNNCEVFNKALAGNAIKTIYVDVAKDRIYAGLADGIMWKCLTNEKHRCENFNKAKADNAIKTIYVAGNTIYAGLADGIMWKCSTDEKHSCEDFNKAGSAIETIFVDENTIYAGLADGIMWKCRTDEKHRCKSLFKADQKIKAIDVNEGLLSALTDGDAGEEVITCFRYPALVKDTLCDKQKNISPHFYSEEHKVEECPISRLRKDSPISRPNLDVTVNNYENWKGKIQDHLKGACTAGTETLYVTALDEDKRPHIYFLEICKDSRNIPESRKWFWYNYVTISQNDSCLKGAAGEKLRFVHSMFVGDYTSQLNNGTIEGLVLGAGMVEITDGEITKINNCSGHYKPSKYFLNQSIKLMKDFSKIHFSEDVKISEGCEGKTEKKMEEFRKEMEKSFGLDL